MRCCTRGGSAAAGGSGSDARSPEPDTDGPYRDYMEAEVIPGMTVFVGRGGVETARNVGAEPYREIIIELKD